MRFTSLKSGLLAGGIAILTAPWPGTPLRAQPSQGASSTAAAPASSGGGAVVARVGKRVITAADLERRIAAVPLFQIRSFGRTPEEIRRNFLERVMVREILFAEGAVEQKLNERQDVQDRIRSILRGMLLGRVRADTAASAPVTPAEVRAYYEENRAKFNAPARVAIWRILVASRDEAAQVIEEVKKDLTPKRWNEIAREKSLDKSTGMRGGNLGFVAPDGTTAESAVRVPTEVVVAAARVKDGELVPEPVKEGDRYAVVWRRQSMRPVARTVEQEDLSIRQILAHKKVEAALKTLLEKVRQERLTELNVELVDQIDITSSGELQPVKRPGTLPASRRPGAARPVPEKGHSGGR